MGQEGAELVGQTIGAYRISACLGRGGMGAVYLGEHQTLGRQAAIKVLHPMFAAQDRAVERFFNEARAVNVVRHPGLVDIYDHGQSSQYGAYLVMEFLEGESLEEHLLRLKRLPLPQVAQIIKRIAGPLAAAHEHGIIHRDLKPANIFLLPDFDHPGEHRVKVLDFGIAKLTEATGLQASKTRTGAILGTPLYMSPEQCMSKPVDHRADVYALGIMAYEMLAGRPPFCEGGFGTVMADHLHRHPPPLEPLAGRLPPGVEAAIAMALAKEPAARFAGVKAFGNALAAAAAPNLAESMALTSAVNATDVAARAASERSHPHAAVIPPTSRVTTGEVELRVARERQRAAEEQAASATLPQAHAAQAHAPQATALQAHALQAHAPQATTPQTHVPQTHAPRTRVAAPAAPATLRPGDGVFTLDAQRRPGGGPRVVRTLALVVVILAVAAGGALLAYEWKKIESQKPGGASVGQDGAAAARVDGGSLARGPTADSATAASPADMKVAMAPPVAPEKPVVPDPPADPPPATPDPPPAPKPKTFMERLPPQIARAYRRGQHLKVLGLCFKRLKGKPKLTSARDKDLLTVFGMSACQLRKVQAADRVYQQLRGARKRRMARTCRKRGIPMD